MTLVETEVLGEFDYYKPLIRDLGLIEEFTTVCEQLPEGRESLDNHEPEVGTAEIVEDVLEEAPDDYVLTFQQRGPRYKVIRLPDDAEEPGSDPAA
jgi:hypothetical protein